MHKLTVITRTKNRSVLLERCGKSLGQQKFRDFNWCIVNDGGDVSPVNDVVEKFKKENSDLNVQVVHNSISVGMEAASNMGLRSSESDLVHILDDDDTIHCDFYMDAVSVLNEVSTDRFLGVVCSSRKIYERVNNGSIDIISSEPLHYSGNGIYIADILQKNQFSNNSLIFRRSVLEKVGFFDETLPVLGDWDFNIRLLLAGDLLFLKKEYSFHHIRLGAAVGAEQTMVSGQGLHELYTAVIKNKIYRSEGVVLAISATVGRQIVKIESNVRDLLNAKNSEWTIKKAIKYLFKK